jgi:PKD repeat protein
MNERKINRFEGNFTLEVGTDDHLAGRIATIGDLNGDGTVDIVASVTGDDDGGADRGGFYTIFLEYCPAPSGDFDFEVNGPEVSFFAEGGEGYSYIWNFDDGGYSEQQNPVHTYENTGTYMVCLAINNECGGDNFCENVQVSNVLELEEKSASEIKIFPNPTSDRIFVAGTIHNAEVRILDITGKEVYIGTANRNGIDTSTLNEGLYLIEFTRADKRTVKKFRVVR